MNRREAIKALKGLLDCSYVDSFEPEENEALSLAISSLETDETYQLEYEKPTTKNDLGVDCISRDDVRDVMLELWGTSGELMDRLMVLPSVTPIRPKGHWVVHGTPNNSHYYDCSLCGCVAPCTEFADSYLWKLSNFCPDCGCRMVEPQESEGKQ